MWNLQASHNCILIVQSLREGDWDTGVRLYRKLWREVIDGVDHIAPILVEVPSAQIFVNFLETLAHEGQYRSLSPILHLDLHGSEDGIEFSNGTRLGWTTFARKLRPINGNSRNNLMLVMATCKGYHLLKVQYDAIFKPCPYWGLIGAKGELKEWQIERGFLAFYQTLGKGDGRKAVEALNESSKGSFFFASADQVFTSLFLYYVSQTGSAQARLRRVEALISEIVGAGMPRQHITEVRKQLKAAVKLDGQEPHYERLRRIFLWIAQFPEILPRFPLDFEAFRSLGDYGQSKATSRV